MGIKKAVAIRINNICSEKGITIYKLANMCGLTQSTLYSVLDDSRNDIGIVNIQKICNGLNLSMFDFFNDEVFEKLEQEIK